MGCVVSTVTVVPGKQLDEYLEKDDIRLVRESWAIVSLDMVGSGVVIFKRMFETESDVKELFKRMTIRLSNGEEGFDEEKLEKHALIVMQGLGAAVESLDDSVYLTNVLITMGKRHSSYRVKPDMVQCLWPAIQHGLRDVLKEKYDENTHRAWRRVFNYLASKLTEGIMMGE